MVAEVFGHSSSSSPKGLRTWMKHENGCLELVELNLHTQLQLHQVLNLGELNANLTAVVRFDIYSRLGKI